MSGMMTFGVVLGAVGLLVAGAAYGFIVAVDDTITHIAQSCARDGSFELVRDGITWTYTCSKPRFAAP